jgi:hypothetical protein
MMRLSVRGITFPVTHKSSFHNIHLIQGGDSFTFGFMAYVMKLSVFGRQMVGWLVNNELENNVEGSGRSLI